MQFVERRETGYSRCVAVLKGWRVCGVLLRFVTFSLRIVTVQSWFLSYLGVWMDTIEFDSENTRLRRQTGI